MDIEKASFFVLSGPSGVGKTEVYKGLVLREELGLRKIVTCTTRGPRNGEKDGIDYHFLSLKEFERMISGKELLEYANVYGNYYGSKKSEVENYIFQRYNPLLVVDIFGALSVKKNFPKSKTIFLSPTSLEILQERLSRRNTDSQDVIQKRLKAAEEEMKYASKFDYIVINEEGKLQQTIENVAKIIKQESQ